MISGSRGTPWEPGWVRGGHPSDGRCHSRSAQGVLASCQAPLAGNGTDQQGQLDERKAPELGGAWAPGECSRGGQGGDAAAWSPEGLPSQGAHPGWPGAAALLDVTLAIRKSPRSARLSAFSLGLHYNHIIEAI